MSRRPKGGRRDSAPAEPAPFAAIAPGIFERLAALAPEVFERDADEPRRSTPVPPVEARQAKPRPGTPRPVHARREPFDMIPKAVRLAPWNDLSPIDKLIYWGLLSSRWTDRDHTTATNAKIRGLIGGETRIELFEDRLGRRCARNVVVAGPSDATIQRSLGRLERMGLIARERDPMTASNRRIVFRVIAAAGPVALEDKVCTEGS
jgi:hypothetical protein